MVPAQAPNQDVAEEAYWSGQRPAVAEPQEDRRIVRGEGNQKKLEERGWTPVWDNKESAPAHYPY